MRVGGHDLAMPLSRVSRVVLGSQLRVVQNRQNMPGWWSGITLTDNRPHPLLNVGDLLGAADYVGNVREAVVVMTSLNNGPIGLVCDRFRGIIPAGEAEWPVSDSLFAENSGSFPGARLWAGRLVLNFEAERFFPAQRRVKLEQVMKNSKENVDQLWELSELESQLAAAPTAQGYTDLAARYRKLGWLEDAERMQTRAAEVKTAAPAAVVSTATLNGPLSPRILLELLHVLHATGKSGELLLDAPGAITGAITLRLGEIIDARSADADEPERAVKKLMEIKAGRYQFFPGAPSAAKSTLEKDTATVLAQLESQVVSS